MKTSVLLFIALFNLIGFRALAQDQQDFEEVMQDLKNSGVSMGSLLNISTSEVALMIGQVGGEKQFGTGYLRFKSKFTAALYVNGNGGHDISVFVAYTKGKRDLSRETALDVADAAVNFLRSSESPTLNSMASSSTFQVGIECIQMMGQGMNEPVILCGFKTNMQ